MAKKSKFQLKCEAAAETTGVAVEFYHDSPDSTPDAFEDDGCLHVRTRGGLRACFDVSPSQELSGAEQNERTRDVLKALDMESKITDRVLVEEDDEEDEDDGCCPHCGRGGW